VHLVAIADPGAVPGASTRNGLLAWKAKAYGQQTVADGGEPGSTCIERCCSSPGMVPPWWTTLN